MSDETTNREPDALEPSPLTFATTDELVKELQSRFNYTLFVADGSVRNNANLCCHSMCWSGGWSSALGLAVYAKTALLMGKVDRDSDED